MNQRIEPIGVEVVKVPMSDGDYWIGRHLVTNEQYKLFVDDLIYPSPSHWEDGEIPEGKEEHPVVYVSWHDARAYCHWASEIAGLPIRLPTEEEWERAARGTDGREYPWGDEFDQSLCNTFGSGIGGTTPVGQYSPQGDSPYGCTDMAGNVWEWCDDRMGSRDHCRVLRGGSWLGNQRAARCAYRIRNIPGYFDLFRSNCGFRVALRGGSFSSYARSAYCENRHWLTDPDSHSRIVGFRVALRSGSFDSYARNARCECRFGDRPLNGWGDSGFRVAVPNCCPCLPCNPPPAPKADTEVQTARAEAERLREALENLTDTVRDCVMESEQKEPWTWEQLNEVFGYDYQQAQAALRGGEESDG